MDPNPNLSIGGNVQDGAITTNNHNKVNQIEPNIKTDGGAVINGNVAIKDGDYVSRDKTNYETQANGESVIAQGNQPVAMGPGSVYVNGSVQLPAKKEFLRILPSQPDYLAGRKNLLKKIKAILLEHKQSELNAVAIIGMGGIGKTALAKYIANAVIEDFPGGVFEGYELSTEDSNPTNILKQWITKCGETINEKSNESPSAAVQRLFIERQNALGRILVVIDDVRLNWHSGDLSVIKDALPPDVPMLITTRQKRAALRINAKIFELNVLSRDESCQLLRHFSSKQITDADADKISKLCGDMPLALNLSARFLKLRSADWLITRLEVEAKRLDILKDDKPTNKKDSVQLSFNISYQALIDQSPESSRIFRSLAVFAQPAFIARKHFVDILAQGEMQEQPNQSTKDESIRKVEDQFLQLADWCLLSEEKSVDSANMEYFSMHTLLHEYAQHLLNEHPDELTEAIANHIRYCVAWANANQQLNLQIHQTNTQMFKNAYGQLLQALKYIEEAYLPTVINFGKEPDLPYQIISIVNALNHHWQLHSKFMDQTKWLDKAYQCADGLNDVIKKAGFAQRLGRVFHLQNNFDEAEKRLQDCRVTLEGNTSQDANNILSAMYIDSAIIQYHQGHFEAAEKDCEQGIALGDNQSNKTDQLRNCAEGYNLLGAIHLHNGKLDLAFNAFEESIKILEIIGDEYSIAHTNDNISSIYYNEGRLIQARDAGKKNLRYWENFPNRIELAEALTNLGLIWQRLGAYPLAFDHHQRAIEISDRIGVPRIQAIARNNFVEPCISLKKFAEAEKYIHESLDLQEKYKLKEYWIATQCSLAELAYRRGFYEQAIDVAKMALDLAEKDSDDPFDTGEASRMLGQAYYGNSNWENARKYLEISLDLLRDNGYKYEIYLTLQILAKVYTDLGDLEKAQVAADEAQILAVEMGIRSPDA